MFLQLENNKTLFSCNSIIIQLNCQFLYQNKILRQVNIYDIHREASCVYPKTSYD